MVTQKNHETMQNLQRGESFNLFTSQDHSIIREAMGELGEVERTLILLRFWERNTLTEIGQIMDLSFQEVEKRLNGAFEQLKKICLSQKDFSRSNQPRFSMKPFEESLEKEKSPERVA